MPPHSVSPPMPVSDTLPVGVTRPKTCVSRSTSASRAPPWTWTVIVLRSTRTARIARQVDDDAAVADGAAG